ncbi:MAG TPA: SDR family oxidoreductase [Anaerolineaceae bacterium]
MKLTVFGGTGRTGQLVVEQALAAGHEVIVLARNPEKVAIQHPALEIVQGDVQDAAAVERALSGADAVISVLGPTSNEPVFAVSRGMQHILAVMQRQGTRRLVISAGAGVGDPQDAPGLFNHLMNFLLKTVAKNVYLDMQKTVDLVRASTLDWTVVRVPMLVDGSQTGSVKAGYVGKGMGPRITRADMAAFLLRQVEENGYVRQSPAISN